MAPFFIDRPIFAWVISTLISLAGVLSIFTLGVESYPSIAPPQIVINANYNGASAGTAEKTVTQVIEQQLTGIDHLLYFSSQSSSNGRVTITLTFEGGTDPDTAQEQVQELPPEQVLPQAQELCRIYGVRYSQVNHSS